MNCTACGKELNPGVRFCSNCGQAVTAQPYTPPAQPYTPPAQPYTPPAQPYTPPAQAYAPPAQPYGPPPPAQRIYRPLYGRMLGGVCAGFAQHFGWDVALVRILLLVLVVFGCGTPILAYLIAWMVIPNEPFITPSQTYAPPPAPPATPPNGQPAA